MDNGQYAMNSLNIAIISSGVQNIKVKTIYKKFRRIFHFSTVETAVSGRRQWRNLWQTFYRGINIVNVLMIEDFFLCSHILLQEYQNKCSNNKITIEIYDEHFINTYICKFYSPCIYSVWTENRKWKKWD